MFDFTGRVLLLTGAGSGIGRGTAEYFYRCGASLVLGDINEAAVTEVARTLDPKGERTIALRYDAACATDAQALWTPAWRALEGWTFWCRRPRSTRTA